MSKGENSPIEEDLRQKCQYCSSRARCFFINPEDDLMLPNIVIDYWTDALDCFSFELEEVYA